jgi:outer membrane immunogenic protein
MRKSILLAIAVLAGPFLAGSSTLSAQVQTGVTGTAHPLELTLSYSALHANGPPGGCSCFWMQGGTAEFNVDLLPRLSAVGELSIHHAADVNSAHEGLGLGTYLLGLRYSQATRSRLVPFAQALVGGVHGFDAYFPNPDGSRVTPDGLAASFGGGINLNLSSRFALRAFQADYLLTSLPNDAGNWQNNFRLGAGIVIRFGVNKGSRANSE